MKKLETIERWNELLELSHKKPVIIYKHSEYCAVCSNAIGILSQALAAGKIKLPIYKVVVHNYRDISNKIEDDLGIKHESPQLIIVKEGQALYVANHYDINIEDVLEYLSE